MNRPRPRRVAPVAGLLFGMAVLGAAPARAADFTVTGRFLFEDRIWDAHGYTGAVQNLPIRYADVEVVKSAGNVVLATGSTDGDGNYSIPVTGQTGSLNLYVRCLSATDNQASYHIKVVDTFTRSGGTVDLSGSSIHAITTGTVNHDTAMSPLAMGDYLIEDTTGYGVAQAFNILDDAVDAFDYLADPSGIGRYPDPSEFLVYGFDPPGGSTGSNYFWHGIFITANTSVGGSGDTDGWADAVILHETGHWADDMFGRDDNPGGAHYIGDNQQDPRLSYGEGYATFFCAQVREFRAARLNLLSQPVDDHVSIYADLSVPPAVGNPGGLEFAYDFETGLFDTGEPIGQIGSANETNVTSALWDLVDGTTTPDESPGSDDEPGDDTGALSWDVIRNYMTTQSPPDWITVEDFYTGWFVRHGSGFMQTEIDSAFIGLGGMPFRPDAFEPDGTLQQAAAGSVHTYVSIPGGGVVLNEVELGSPDAVELLNVDTLAVSLTGWEITGERNATTPATYTLPAFTLQPGAVVVVIEGGVAADNSAGILHAEGLNWEWANGLEGACSLLDDVGDGVDFVRWDGAEASTTPVPAGTAFTGNVDGPDAGFTLGRDADGTDTDQGSDWGTAASTFGLPNFPDAADVHTIYPAGDVDVIGLPVHAGDLVVAWARAFHSAGEPRLELLGPGGDLLGIEEATYGLASLAQVQFLAQSDTTYYARLSHEGTYTDFATFDVRLYARPVSRVLNPPTGVLAVPWNQSDTEDTVRVTWLNGGAYDQIAVFRDGLLRASLVGGTTSFTDVVARGEHSYGVLGVVGGMQSAQSLAHAFAGLLSCHLEDGLESGTASFLLDAPWARTSSLADSGSWSLTDSPGGNYGDDVDVSARILAPVDIVAWPILEFDHICITEATYDFGIVEVSTDFGNHWIELARYDDDDYPGWNDHSADPGDWEHESLSLAQFAGKKVEIRFRLLTDGYVNEDGWYLDNVRISDPGCDGVTGVEPEPPPPVTPILRLVGGNPFRGSLRLALAAPAGSRARVEVFDTLGRRVALVFEGVVPGEGTEVRWDGRDRLGRPAAAGVYLLRAATPAGNAVQRVVKLP